MKFEIFIPTEFYHLNNKFYDKRIASSDKLELQIHFMNNKPYCEYISQDNYSFHLTFGHIYGCDDICKSQIELLCFIEGKAVGNFKQRILRLINKYKKDE